MLRIRTNSNSFQVDSTIIATVLTLIVSFVVIPVYKKVINSIYTRKFLMVYEKDYIMPLKNILELHYKNDDGLYLYEDELNILVDKIIQELAFSRERELNYLSSDYSFELIRINSYTMAIIGDIKKLSENYYLFNDLSKRHNKYQSIVDKEIVKECLILLDNFEIEAKRYYKLKFDRIILKDTKIKEMINKYDLELGK